MTEEMKDMCRSLTLQDKVEVRDYLSDLIASARGGVGKSPLRCSILLGVMAGIMGVRYIPFISRIPEHVWARTMVAYQMIREGYSTPEIGRQMMKDHSSVTHMKKRMQDALDLPVAYRDILNLWEIFQKQIQS